MYNIKHVHPSGMTERSLSSLWESSDPAVHFLRLQLHSWFEFICHCFQNSSVEFCTVVIPPICYFQDIVDAIASVLPAPLRRDLRLKAVTHNFLFSCRRCCRFFQVYAISLQNSLGHAGTLHHPHFGCVISKSVSLLRLLNFFNISFI